MQLPVAPIRYVPAPRAHPQRPFRAELAPLVRLALPLAITQAGQALMGVVDVAVLGRAGPVLLGASGLGNALFFGIAHLRHGVMHGLDPLVVPGTRSRRSRSGRGSSSGREPGSRSGSPAALALPIAAVPDPARALRHRPGRRGREARRFLLWRLLGLPFFFLYFAYARLPPGAPGALRPLVVAVVIANVVNLGVDVLLVFGGAGLPSWTGPLRALPALGVVGSAWATNLARWLQVPACSAWQCEPCCARPAAGPSPRPDLRDAGAALRVGLPAGLHMFAEVSFFALASLLAGRLGALSLSAHQVALQIASLTVPDGGRARQRRLGPRRPGGGRPRSGRRAPRRRGGARWRRRRS